MIFTGFQPNATKKDITTALKYLLLPWKWGQVIRGGEYEAKACRMLRKKFSVYHTYLFDSGRSALEISLKTLGIGEGDEVIVQAYTCVVVVNAIKWVGAIPVYVDVRPDFNIDVEKIKPKITPKTKAIIAQHTFGIPCEIDRIVHIARENGLAVIEDAAHVIEGEYKGKKLGTYGDIGMFSFGSDKPISCGRGGALITTNDAIGEKIGAEYEKVTYPKRMWVLPYLWNFPLFIIGKALYKIKIGKFMLAALKKLSITGRVIYDKEKKGERSHFKVSRL
ncbi:MAG TPA: DegT/DnrJ/EryC1/StrS family aminotransferase, partial [Candidatus Magasanikbacteria bacterium]|nr:DegT/DnrJ/EryC1/StrS family aminotransferase [Candidatus Magasanikbacteria bacterium]